MNGLLAGFLLAFLAILLKRLIIGYRAALMNYALDVAISCEYFLDYRQSSSLSSHLMAGRLLSIIMEAIFGVRGVKISLFISMVLSALVGVIFFAMQAFLPGCLFLIMTYESYQAFRTAMKHEGNGLQHCSTTNA